MVTFKNKAKLRYKSLIMKLEIHEDYTQPWTEKDIYGNFPEKYKKLIVPIALKASLIEGDFGFSLLQTRNLDETSVCQFNLGLTTKTSFRLLLEEDMNALFYCIKNNFRIQLPDSELTEIQESMYTLIQFPAGSHKFRHFGLMYSFFPICQYFPSYF